MNNSELQVAIKKYGLDIEHFSTVSEISFDEFNDCIEKDLFPSFIEIAFVFYIENIDKFKEEVRVSFLKRAVDSGFVIEDGKVIIPLEGRGSEGLEVIGYENEFIRFKLKKDK
jgi:hypothetical protein